MRSVMEHSFANVPRADIPRSSFNRSHGLKTTFDCDALIPILVDEVLPGDTYRVNATHFVRLATPLHPIMDNIYIETFFFFVPYRLVWDNWEKFCGAQEDPADSIDFTIPALGSSTTADLTAFAMCDYMGLPYATSADLTEISALPFRCVNLIWNEWFRDQNLQDSALVDTGDGPDTLGAYPLHDRGKRHDYFTSCLPWPQKGGAVSLPLGTSAPISGIGVATGNTAEFAGPTAFKDATGLAEQYTDYDTYVDDGADPLFAIRNTGPLSTDRPDIYADLSVATAATINQLRLAFQTQRLLERDARSGTRYVETILAHYGVTVPDFRVQRPEFLGGGSSTINMTPVAQSSRFGSPSELGYLAAYGTGSGTHGFTKSFVEHGIIIGFVNARADITYQQGLDRMWSRSTRFDFYYPVLSQIGEQSVFNSEIYYQNLAADDLVFGYQERYAEYRYKRSQITGLFRSENAASLDLWHLSEEFTSLPALGATFIRSNSGIPLDRAIAVPTEPHFIADFYFDMRCARPMPLQGVPGNLDHF